MYLRKLSAIGFLLALALRAASPSEGERLIESVQAGDRDAVRKLIQQGVDVKASTRNGVTPLWVAVMNRDFETVDMLLKAGANPNAALPGGETTLMTAARAGDAEVAELLIKHGANVAAAGPGFGETALMMAAMANQAGVIEVLLKHGAELNGRSKELSYSKDRFGLEGVLTILPHGTWTPLMYAAREGAVDAARALCDAGAELNATDPDGSTSLLLAIANGHFDAAALLVEKGRC